MLLKNWHISVYPNYIEHEKPIVRLHGNVFDHPMFYDGERINTSYVEEFTLSDTFALIQTHSGSQYILDKNECLKIEGSPPITHYSYPSGNCILCGEHIVSGHFCSNCDTLNSPTVELIKWVLML